MSTKAWKLRYQKRKETVAKYAELRKRLKKEKNYMELSMLPRDASPTRVANRCELTGRRRGYYRKFRMSRLMLRQLALEGKIPGLKKASW
jgi:small subunit ribosomal protein S14